MVRFVDHQVDRRSYPPHVLLQQLGSEWVEFVTSLVLEVSSAMSPHESNFPINPMHPDIHKIGSKSTVPATPKIKA